MTALKILLSTTVAVVALCLAPSATAGFDIDFGASVQLNDRTDLYFSISSRYFDRDHDTVSRWGSRYRDPDDLAVALFINRHSGRSLPEIWDLRHHHGLTWWEISMRFGVPVDVWFVTVQRDPGPPYGKAYGHWKHHKHKRQTSIALTDVDVRHLVAVRMVHEYYGVSVDAAMQWRSDGTNLRDLMAGQYEKRHGKPDHAVKNSKSSESHPGQGHGKNKKK